MKKLLLCLLITLLALVPIASLTASAATDAMLSDCESTNKWTPAEDWYTVTLDTEDFTEGSASVKYAFSLGGKTRHIAVEHRFGPVDATGCNALQFDFYVSDPAIFANGQEAIIELTSAGTCDREESYWGFNFDIKPGWNTLNLPITPNTCYMNRLNYFRIYLLNIRPYTTQPIVWGFDNMRAVFNDPEQYASNVQGQLLGSLKESKGKVSTAFPTDTPITRTETETYLRTELLTIAIVLLVAAAGALAWFVVVIVMKRKAQRMISIALGVVLAIGGTVTYLAYLVPQTREVEIVVPQMDNEQIEQALKVDKEFDTKEAYSLNYVAPKKDKDDPIPEHLKKWDFRTPTLVSSERNPEQYIVATTTVIAFGARGDGVTNDTTAFINAISFAKTQGGGTVFIPAGNYVLTAALNIPQGVVLVGELEHGTVNGTVLQIYSGKGKPKGMPAISMEFQSGIKNVAFWYPEQTFVNGAPIPYPPTIRQKGSEGITVENVNFVNSYYAIDMSDATINSNSLQTIRDITGTPLSVGTDNDNSLDIGRFENIHFSPEYWLSSGFEGIPDQRLLRTWLLRNATAIRIGRVDWTYYTDIKIEGYQIGVDYYVGTTGTANGHLYNASITDCYYPIYCKTNSHLALTKCVLSAVGNDGAVALYVPMGPDPRLNLSHCTLTSAGKNAIVNASTAVISLAACNVTSDPEGTPFVITKAGRYTAVNTTFTGKKADYIVSTAEIAPIPEVDYNRVVMTKPKSDSFINLEKAPYEVKNNADITKALQAAIDSLKATGGTVYIPGGTYTVSEAITVWDGIEICGAQDVPHYFPHTTIYTDYGANQPDAPALFTLKAGAGMRGIGINYNKISRHGRNLPPYAYTIRGDGANVYIVNCTIPFTYNGVDFATNRCDNHYIEYLWGCAGNNAIQVGGGSENGIIRDCMFTQNTSWTVADGNYLGIVHSMLLEKSTTFRVGKTKNQIVYHTFVFAAMRGLEITDGAENCFVLSHGTDFGNIAVYVSGDATATLVDPQMVAREGAVRAYICADSSFKGTLNIYNGACWGTPNISFPLRGNATYNFYQTYIANPGNDVFELTSGELNLVGIARFDRTKYDVEVFKTDAEVNVNGCFFDTKPVYLVPEGAKLEGDDVPKE